MSTAPTLPIPAAAVPAHDAPALTLSAADLANELRVSVKTITRMDQSGRLPAAVGVGHEKRWLQSTIVAWIADGCPGRGEWEAKSKRPKLFDFPFALELFGFTLSKRCYEDVFEPEHKDMVAKFECAHGDRFRTAPCRWCLNIAFAIRTGAIVVRCLRRPICAALLVCALPYAWSNGIGWIVAWVCR